MLNNIWWKSNAKYIFQYPRVKTVYNRLLNRFVYSLSILLVTYVIRYISETFPEEQDIEEKMKN